MKTHYLLFIVIAIACNACQKDELIVLPDERDDVTGTYVGFRATHFTTWSFQLLQDTFKAVVILSKSSKDSIITVTSKPSFSNLYKEFKYHNGEFKNDPHAILELNGDDLYMQISPGLTGNSASYYCIKTDRPDTIVYINPEPVDPCLELKIMQLSHQWMAPFNSKTFELFEDNNGVIDTMWITRTTSVETCTWNTQYSAVPCSAKCDVETVELISGSNDRLKLVLKIMGHELSVNATSGIPMKYDLLKHLPLSTGGSPFFDYRAWFGKEPDGYYTEEVSASCNFPPLCESMYELLSYKITRTSGVTNYSTKGGRLWHKKL